MRFWLITFQNICTSIPFESFNFKTELLLDGKTAVVLKKFINSCVYNITTLAVRNIVRVTLRTFPLLSSLK